MDLYFKGRAYSITVDIHVTCGADRLKITASPMGGNHYPVVGRHFQVIGTNLSFSETMDALIGRMTLKFPPEEESSDERKLADG